MATAMRPTKEWWGPQAALLPVLMEDALNAPNSGWFSRQLSSGVLVSCRWDRGSSRQLHGYFTVRIARQKAPEGEAGRAAWERELETFRQSFKMSDEAWTREDEVRNSGGIAVRYVEKVPEVT